MASKAEKKAEAELQELRSLSEEDRLQCLLVETDVEKRYPILMAMSSAERSHAYEVEKKREKRREAVYIAVLVVAVAIIYLVPATRMALTVLFVVAMLAGAIHHEWRILQGRLKKAERREREIYQELEKARKELAEYAERERWAREDVVN